MQEKKKAKEKGRHEKKEMKKMREKKTQKEKARTVTKVKIKRLNERERAPINLHFAAYRA